MITTRRANDRFHTETGWLDSRHTFSFDMHYDPRHMGFRALRVINDDRVHAGQGFPPHAHADMEILSYVVSGALQHRDSMGNGAVVRPGELQRMSAGRGVTHSEFNPLLDQPVHFLQIWIRPERKGLEPSYEQKAFPEAERRGRLRLMAAPDGRDGAVRLHQDVELRGGLLEPGERVRHELRPGRHAWVQVVRGRVSLNGVELQTGDGASASDEAALDITCAEAAEVLVFDLA